VYTSAPSLNASAGDASEGSNSGSKQGVSMRERWVQGFVVFVGLIFPSVDSYYWGGFYYTSFVIDPKEDFITIFMGQINPAGGLNLGSKAITLAYQAIKD
jgi:hypothetical protein